MTRKEIALLISLAFIQFSHIVDFMVMMPLGPQLMRIFNISPQQFGFLVSGYTFAAGASGLLSALVLDRFDRKKSLMFFYVGFGVGTLICGFCDTHTSLLFARILTGAFGGVLGSLILAIVGDVIRPEKRGAAMGIVMSAFSLASVAGVPISLYFANHLGWHAPFKILGGLALLLLFVIYKAVPAIDQHVKNNAGRPKSILEPFRVILAEPNQMLALLFVGLIVFGQFAVIPFLSPSLVANAGMTEAQLPLLYLCGGAVSLLTSPQVGRFSDKFGKRKIFIIFAFLSIFPLYLVTHLGVTPVPLILTCTVLFFVCTGGRMIPAMAMVQGTVRPQHRGSFMSVVSSFQQLAAAAASLISGMIIIRGANGELQRYGWVGYVAIGFTLLSILAAQRLKAIEGHF